MNLYVASNSGFCFGVKEAVKKTTEAAKTEGPVVTYGELIHNKQVIDSLSALGVDVVEKLEDVGQRTMIIRSHGVPPQVYDQVQTLGLSMIDATCPFVKKIHRIVSEHAEKGYFIVIVGSKGHPEVTGINGWCNDQALIVGSAEDLNVESTCFDKLLASRKICVVAQTTITKELWITITEKLQKMLLTSDNRVSKESECCSLSASKSDYPEIVLFNTICSATTERQNSTEELAKRVDLMIVIGGSHSSNTQKLYQIAKKYCENTIYAETVQDLVMKDIKKCGNIGITAGASTPDWIIKEIIDKIEDEGGVHVNG